LSPSGAFPPDEGQWLRLRLLEGFPITVAGPCRSLTGFPILPDKSEHRTLFCFR